MRCNNCRCVIPNNSEYCVYCGHKVPLGEEETLRVNYGGWSEGSERTYAVPPVYRGYPESVRYYPPYAEFGDGTLYRAETPYYQQESNTRGFDLVLFNDDGSLDVVKALVFFAGFNIAFILILLLLFLLMLL